MLPPSTIQSDKRPSKGVKGVPESCAQQREGNWCTIILNSQ